MYIVNVLQDRNLKDLRSIWHLARWLN